MICAIMVNSIVLCHAVDKKSRTRENSAPPKTPNFQLFIMKRSTTTDTHAHDSKLHYHTPRKAKIQGAIEFCEKQGIEYFKNDVFRTFNVDRRQAYTFIADHNSDYTIKDHEYKRLNNNSDQEDYRNRLSLFQPKDIREIDRIIQKDGFKAR